jgi:hypothetical protein
MLNLKQSYKTVFISFSLIIWIIFPIKLYSQKGNTINMKLNLGIPAISLINFYSESSTIVTYTYSLTEKNQVEQIITPNLGDATWLNYSSIVKSESNNYITVNIHSGSFPSEAELYLYISPDVGKGGGKVGIPTTSIVLSYYPQIIISNIGSCFTGVGIQKGHQLKYVWKNAKDYEIKYENGEKISVIYTITST